MVKILWQWMKLLTMVLMLSGFIYELFKIPETNHFEIAVLFGIMLIWFEMGEKK